MGQLREKIIQQNRVWLSPQTEPIPPYDFNFVYPVTVYEAIKKNMDDDSPSLIDELEAIYRLINNKQEKIPAGTPGNVMIYTGIEGQLGQAKINRAIADPSDRTHKNLLSEKAIGDALDSKASITMLGEHTNDTSVHLTDVERTRWNGMAPLTTLNSHVANTTMHITDVERARWNSKAAQEDIDDHVANTNNPHNVTAHQAGTYTRQEIDTLFAALRETFFNYMNIEWDDRTNQAKLVNYRPANWNPNYILAYGDTLPDVPDPSLIYFALKPITDYMTNESNDVSIWIKRPGMIWHEVGAAVMKAGDMVIKFPSTTMYVWVQGRFVKLFSGNANDELGEGDNLAWRPSLNSDGELIWTLSPETTPPDPMVIKGKDGKTPEKGVDYFDGINGVGVPVGGESLDILVKITDANHDTTWKSLWDILVDLVTQGKGLPPDVVIWDNIKGRPKIYDAPGNNTDGVMTQKATMDAIDAIQQGIIGLNLLSSTVNGLKTDFQAHVNDFNNPHRLTPAIIGAASVTALSDHTQNFSNPHAVTKDQIGLGNVDNTKDINKPISIPVQEALDQITDRITLMGNPLVDVVWDAPRNELNFKFNDGSVIKVEMEMSGGIESITFDSDTNEMIVTFNNGQVSRLPVASLLKYTGVTGTHINVIIENDNKIKADIIPASIGELEITPNVHLRGNPTTNTAGVSDNSSRIATTEFVKKQTLNNLISYETDRPLSANMGRLLNQRKADVDDVIQMIMDLHGFEVVDSLDSTITTAALSANMGRHLDLTKAPRVHTSPSGSTFGVATVALFGHVRSANVDPQMDGTVFRGTDDGYYARADHRHPSDDSKLDKNGLITLNETFNSGNDIPTTDTISEFLGFTTEMYNLPDNRGNVNKVLFNINFKYFKNTIPTVEVMGTFKALMGNNTMIPLTNPIQVSKTKSHVSLLFTLSTPYPSNSPCALVFGDQNSNIKVTV